MQFTYHYSFFALRFEFKFVWDIIIKVFKYHIGCLEQGAAYLSNSFRYERAFRKMIAVIVNN